MYYTLNPELPVSMWIMHEVAGGNSQLTTISELMPNRTYTISVLAYNSVGEGPRSEPKLVMTTQGGENALHCAPLLI